jgi:hypothetical protein
MERAASLLKSWTDEYQENAARSKNPDDKKAILQAKQDFETILAVLLHLGIKHNAK